MGSYVLMLVYPLLAGRQLPRKRVRHEIFRKHKYRLRTKNTEYIILIVIIDGDTITLYGGYQDEYFRATHIHDKMCPYRMAFSVVVSPRVSGTISRLQY